MTSPANQPNRPPILLIEDKPSVMAYLQAALERGDYPVVC